VVAGGVGANLSLRERLEEIARQMPVRGFIFRAPSFAPTTAR
jgi:tRNA A37 threonylcarbamoyltransferase TsaD